VVFAAAVVAVALPSAAHSPEADSFHPLSKVPNQFFPHAFGMAMSGPQAFW
jgi:hypothetical protein